MVNRVNENLKQVELDEGSSRITIQGARYGGKLAEMVDG
jgi:hypothetical protein